VSAQELHWGKIISAHGTMVHAVAPVSAAKAIVELANAGKPFEFPKAPLPVAPIAFTDPAPEPAIEQGPDVELCPNCLRVLVPDVRHECVCEEAA
jgi:hypothetical protein